MSFKITKMVRAFAATALLSISTLVSAAPVPVEFVIDSLSFELKPNSFNGPNRLDVTFAAAPAPAAFSLVELGDPKTFTFGKVTLTEDCINGPQSGCRTGNGNETQNLDVTAVFSFTSPIHDAVKSVAVTGAFVGIVSDAAVDFYMNFDSVFVEFGNGGLFQIDLSDSSFSKMGQFSNLTATVTLLQGELPPPGSEVPEPASLALLGLALAGIAVSRRRA